MLIRIDGGDLPQTVLQSLVHFGWPAGPSWLRAARLGRRSRNRYHYGLFRGEELVDVDACLAPMKRRRPTSRDGIVGLALLGTVVLLAPRAIAQELRIELADCAKPVHVVAKDIPLSTVLRSLSSSLHFSFAYQAETDPLVTTDAKALAPDLVRKLAGDRNFSFEETTDPRCAQGRRIAKLSVLPDGGAKPSAVASAQPAWQTPEMERIAQTGMQDYLRGHGMPPQHIEGPAGH